MGPEEESKQESAPSETDAPNATQRRDRGPGPTRRGRGRGRRGGRGRSRPSRAAGAEVSSSGPAAVGEEAEPIFELAEEPSEAGETATHETERGEIPDEPMRGEHGSRQSEPASTTSVEQAITEVNGIVDALRGALDDMEEVLEMLELFERQKNADEREIESLRHALRQVHRPRDAGHHQHR